MTQLALFKRIQAGADTFYNILYYRGSISVQAFREGRDKGLVGDALAQFRNEQIANPPDYYNTKAVAEVHALTIKRKARLPLVRGLALTVWLLSSCYLFVTHGQTSFFSIKFVGFVVIGAIAASLFIGGAFHILWGVANFLQLVVEGLVEKIVGKIVAVEPSQDWIRFERALIKIIFNLIMCTAEVVSTFALASWMFYYQ